MRPAFGMRFHAGRHDQSEWLAKRVSTNIQNYRFERGMNLLAEQHKAIAGKIWEIANRLRGPYRPPQYRLVMLPMVVLRRLDCVPEPTKGAPSTTMKFWLRKCTAPIT